MTTRLSQRWVAALGRRGERQMNIPPRLTELRRAPGCRRGAPRYVKEIAEYSMSLSKVWRALTQRTVPDFPRITRESVTAPRGV
jgi:hypothetical protein